MTSPPTTFCAPRLLRVGDLNRLEIESLFQAADRFAAAPEPVLAGLTVVNLFLEPSTRTRVSFETAAKRLGAHVINIGDSGSTSMAKGESLRDTVETLDAMAPDIIVARHKSAGSAAHIDRAVSARVINAGDGAHEHPTQALLDALTLVRRWGGLEGKRVVVCGDLRHSRVARSSIELLHHLGARLIACAPETLTPPGVETWGAETVTADFDAALEDADAVMMLRLQNERMQGAFLATPGEYREGFALTRERLAKAKPGALVMHPGPMNRGVEIDPDVADDPAVSVIRDQVAAGVDVRMAVLAGVAQAEAGS